MGFINGIQITKSITAVILKSWLNIDFNLGGKISCKETYIHYGGRGGYYKTLSEDH
jgi:hypothetical protein